MHKYLRAIGFSKYNKKRELRPLLDLVIQSSTASSLITEGGCRSMDTSAGRSVIDLDCVSMGSMGKDRHLSRNTAFPTQTAMSYLPLFPVWWSAMQIRIPMGGCARSR